LPKSKKELKQMLQSGLNLLVKEVALSKLRASLKKEK